MPARTETLRRRGPSLDLLFSAVFGIVGLGVGLRRLSDNSFLTHLVTGRWILDHGFPRGDVYSYTAPGTRWVVQSWLAEVVYAQLDRSFGAFSVRLLGGIVTAAIFVLAYRLALRLARDRVRAAGITAAALAGMVTIWSERPLLLGLLALVVLIWVVEVPECAVGRRPLVVLPVLFWCWANVHGSFALGFAYLALHLVGRWADGARPTRGRERALLVGGAIAALVTLANPYGPALVLFPLDLLSRGDVLAQVREWQSPDFRKPWGQAYLIWVVVYVVVVARARHRVTRRDLVVSVPFLALGFWALRNIAVAPLVGLPVVARAVAVDPRPAEPVPRPEPLGALRWGLAAVLVVIGLGLVASAAGQRDFDFSGYPVAAMRALEDEGLLGRRLLVDDGEAAYVEARYLPTQRVFLDDRYDMFPTTTVWDYLDIARANGRALRRLDDYDVETVVWAKDAPLVQLLRATGDWTEVHRDRRWTALVRNDLAP